MTAAAASNGEDVLAHPGSPRPVRVLRASAIHFRAPGPERRPCQPSVSHSFRGSLDRLHRSRWPVVTGESPAAITCCAAGSATSSRCHSRRPHRPRRASPANVVRHLRSTAPASPAERRSIPGRPASSAGTARRPRRVSASSSIARVTTCRQPLDRDHPRAAAAAAPTPVRSTIVDGNPPGRARRPGTRRPRRLAAPPPRRPWSRAGAPDRLALLTASGPVFLSSSSATWCSGIRTATVPLVSPRSQIRVRLARQTRVRPPGQNSSIRSLPDVVEVLDQGRWPRARCRPAPAAACPGPGPWPRAGRPRPPGRRRRRRSRRPCRSAARRARRVRSASVGLRRMPLGPLAAAIGAVIPVRSWADSILPLLRARPAPR